MRNNNTHVKTSSKNAGKNYSKGGDFKPFSGKQQPPFMGGRNKFDPKKPVDKNGKNDRFGKDKNEASEKKDSDESPRSNRSKRPIKRELREGEDSGQLEGRNPVLEALKSDRPIESVLIKKGENGELEGSLKVIAAMAREKNITIKEMTRQKLDELAYTDNHQGVIAVCSAHEYAEISDILANAETKGEPPFVLLLDGITDPHNLGAIIRTAHAFGAHGVIIPKRRAAGLTAAAGRASAGAVEHLPVARVANISTAIKELKEKGIWVAAVEMGGEPVQKANLSGAIALVIGSEGEGISRLIKENCDFCVSIPMKGEISSLNASVAAGLVMYEILKTRI